jgi:GT2 family glycosyltransferase
MAKMIAGFSYQPKISVLTPVYKTPTRFLDLAVGSVLSQGYQNWELCICDDGSQDAELTARLHAWEQKDRRIKITYSAKNEGISAASNRALALATGEFVGLLDHDDEITPDALFEVVSLLQEHPDADMIYSDEDKLDSEGRRVQPFFKPDWSPEFMLAIMYTCHFGVYRRQLLEEIRGFRKGFEGAQDYDLVLRIGEKTKRIWHVPKVLYHWRMAPGSMATLANSDAKPYAIGSAERALNEHLERRRIPGKVSDGAWRGSYRIRFKLDGMDKVSIVVANPSSPDALKNCVRSIEERSSYRNYELVLPEDTETDNLSRAMNRGAVRAQGDYLLLLCADTEVISPDWIASMLGFCRDPEIGAVGAKLLDRKRRIRHIGVVLGLKGLAGYPLRGLAGAVVYSADPSQLIRNCSAVSGACLMVRKDVFKQTGGFDEELPDACADVDFCLRLRQAGYRIVWTPDAQLYYDALAPSETNGSQSKFFKVRWAQVLWNDPYYNPNLTLKHQDLGYRV